MSGLQNFDSWKGKVSNAAQIGGIETSVLDNGNQRGVRVAWFNTGVGLRFKVVLDRAMDIGEAFYNSHSLAWISSRGIVPPETRYKNSDWLKGFGGGLLATCGLTHVGGAESDEFGERCLHDDIGNIPAQIESIVQPDLSRDLRAMSLSGRILQSTVFGAHLELKRTISAELGKLKIQISDQVTNIENTPAPHMMLYHANLGWPLIDEGSKLIWKGKWNAGNPKDSIINGKNDFTLCPSPLDCHSGNNESVAFIDVDADDNGICVAEARNKKLGFGLQIKFKKSQLPWLVNWQHWGVDEYVTALEPATNPPVGQSRARKDGALKFIGPRESLKYDIEFEIV